MMGMVSVSGLGSIRVSNPNPVKIAVKNTHVIRRAIFRSFRPPRDRLLNTAHLQTPKGH
jgi:hypothetical protein